MFVAGHTTQQENNRKRRKRVRKYALCIITASYRVPNNVDDNRMFCFKSNSISFLINKCLFLTLTLALHHFSTHRLSALPSSIWFSFYTKIYVYIFNSHMYVRYKINSSIIWAEMFQTSLLLCVFCKCVCVSVCVFVYVLQLNFHQPLLRFLTII